MVEVPKGTGKKSSFQKLTIRALFLNHMNIFSVDIARKALLYINSTVDRRKKKIFNRVQAHFIPFSRAGEKKAASAAVSDSMRDKVIYLVNEY